MFKITLINMPFANLQIPSIALTQLKSRLNLIFGDCVSVEVFYLNHDFAQYLGMELCRYITNSHDSHNSGLGDWFFRQVAFPSLPDNTSEYFTRYFPRRSPQIDNIKKQIVEKRAGIEQFLDELISDLNLAQSDLVGFTSMFMQNAASFAMAERLKNACPDIITLMGGANCEFPMGQEIVKNVKQIDFTFSGPALKSFPDFVKFCIDQEMEKCHKIKGVFSKRNYIFQTGPGSIGEELGLDVPVELDYEPFLRTFKDKCSEFDLKPILLFETSRGCWWGERSHCTFCGLNGESMGYRSMSPDLALKQFHGLFKYSEEVKRLDAVDNILPKNYLRDVLPFVETPQNVSMFYEVKADLSEEDCQVLANARVKYIQPGIESLATSTLKLMKKGTNVFQNIQLLKNCSVYGIEPAWNLLIGFPGEGEEVYKKYISDIPLLSHLPPPSGVYPVRFDRYSPYFTRSQSYGLELAPLDYYKLIYPFSDESLANLAYYFGDLNLAAPYMMTMVRWIGKIREKFSFWKSRWNIGQEPAPMLCFKHEKEATIVLDSRAGEMVKHQISENEKTLLEYLNKPKRISDLDKEFDHLSDSELQEEMDILRERGLIFQEADRFISLVLPETVFHVASYNVAESSREIDL